MKYLAILFILISNTSFAQHGHYEMENEDVKIFFDFSFRYISDSVGEFVVSAKIMNKSKSEILTKPINQSTFYPFADEFMFGAQTAFGGSVRHQIKYLTVLSKDSFMLIDNQTISCRIDKGNINALSLPIESFWFTYNYILLNKENVTIDELEFKEVYYD